MVVIGCGNLERGDDGAGILVAQRLRELGVGARVHTGEPLGLIDLWEYTNELILVDAAVTGAPAGTIHAWDGRRSLLVDKSPLSTHGLGVAEVIELARSLNRLPSRLQGYAIEGRCFDLGTRASGEIQGAVEEVVRRIFARIAHQAQPTHEGP